MAALGLNRASSKVISISQDYLGKYCFAPARF